MSEIKVDTLTGKTTANDITVTIGASATMSLEQGLAKAWANNELAGTASVLDSFNQSSFSDDAQGKLTMSFSNAFNSATYSPSAMSTIASASTPYASSGIMGQVFTSSQLEVNFVYANSGSQAYHDVGQSGVNINGDLA